MIEINRIMIKEAAVEDCKEPQDDSTVVEADIHYPTNNELTWDCIKTSHRLLKKLEESGCLKKVRNNQKQAKKNRFQINNTKKEDKRRSSSTISLKLLRNSINQAERAVIEASTKGSNQGLG